MALTVSSSGADDKRRPAPKVTAADNTLRILRLLASKSTPMLASRIATELTIARSSIYDLLGVMEANGFVTHLPEQQRYGLGVNAFELGPAYAHHEPLSRAGKRLLAGLVDSTGETAHLAVLHGRDVLYIAEERAKNRPALVTDVGVRLPSHLTASGRAILAAVPRAQVRALYPNSAAFSSRQETEDPIMKYSTLSSHLDHVSQRGHATEKGQVTPGFESIAVAVRDHRGWPTAAIAITFRGSTVPEKLRPSLADAVRTAADKLSRRLYGQS